MWILVAAAILVNSVANNRTFFLEYRIDFAGMPINILDGLTLAGLLASFLPQRRAVLTGRPHPLLIWILVFFLLATLAGTFGAVIEEVRFSALVIGLRNTLTVPAAVWLGYRVIATPRKALTMGYVIALGSLLSAIFALVFVRDATETIAVEEAAFDLLRTPVVGGDAGLLLACLIPFCLVERSRLLGGWWGLPFLATCGAAMLLLPHRSAWLYAGVTIGFAAFILPRSNPRRKAGVTFACMLVLILAALVSLNVVTQLTGRDFKSYLGERLASMMPGGDGGAKAWDTRTPGLVRELELWASNPILGRGFNYQNIDELTHPGIGYNHTPWVSVTCQMGIAGLVAFFLAICGPILVGWRMVRQRIDRRSLLLAAAGAAYCFSSAVLGWLSMSWNTQRQALAVGLLAGMLLRCRAMQLATAGVAEEADPLPLEFGAGPAFSAAYGQGGL